METNLLASLKMAKNMEKAHSIISMSIKFRLDCGYIINFNLTKKNNASMKHSNSSNDNRKTNNVFSTFSIHKN